MKCSICENNTVIYIDYSCPNNHLVCTECVKARWMVHSDRSSRILVIPCPHPECQCASFHPLLFQMTGMVGHRGANRVVGLEASFGTPCQSPNPELEAFQKAFEAYDALRAIRICEDRERKGKRYDPYGTWHHDPEWDWAMRHRPIPQSMEKYEADFAYIARYTLEEAKSEWERLKFEEASRLFHERMPLFREKALSTLRGNGYTSLLDVATCGYQHTDYTGKIVPGYYYGLRLVLDLAPSRYGHSTKIDYSFIHYLFTGEALPYEELRQAESVYEEYFEDAERRMYEEEENA